MDVVEKNLRTTTSDVVAVHVPTLYSKCTYVPYPEGGINRVYFWHSTLRANLDLSPNGLLKFDRLFQVSHGLDANQNRAQEFEYSARVNLGTTYNVL